MAFISTSQSHTKHLLDAVRRAMGPRVVAEPTARPEDISGFSLMDIRQQVSIPVPEGSKDCEEKSRLHKTAHLLVRQDNWDALGDLIRQHDQDRSMTKGGTPKASILASGARKDLRDTIALGLLPNSEKGLDAASQGIEMLDQVLIDHAQDYGVALVVAQAHMDIGAVWRGQGWADEVPASDWKKFARHFRRATSILEQFDAKELNSPALAAARCRTLAGQPDAAQRAIAYYEELIDLAPEFARSYREFGKHMLPRWYGSYELLEDRARRVVAHSSEYWGTAAYALTYMDAILEDPEALAFVDVAQFLQGLHDFVTAQSDQSCINKVAAFLSVTLAPQGPLVSGSKRAYHNRRALIAAAPEFTRKYLREIHPSIWAKAQIGHDPDAPPAKEWRQNQAGLEEAFSLISHAFECELLRGNRVLFTRDGVDICAA